MRPLLRGHVAWGRRRITHVEADQWSHTAVQAGNATLVALLLEARADAGHRTDLEESIFDVVPFESEERESVLAALARFGITRDD